MKLLLCLAIAFSGASAFADFEQGMFDQQYLSKSKKEKSVFWAPFGSLLVPGLDQVVENQYKSAMLYGGIGAFGLALTFSSIETVTQADGEKKGEFPEIDELVDMPDWDDRTRRFVIGSSILQTAGSYSAYHAFRSAAKTHGDKYNFLKTEDTSKDIMLAPFKFEFLTRATTLIPLGILGAATAYLASSDEHNTGNVNGGDIGFYSTLSYGAGTGEEALLRGWLMPVLRAEMGSDLWANSTQALIFSAAHLGNSDEPPVFQLFAGFYFGWLVQKNDWGLQEAIFLHTWWDVLAFTSLFLSHEKEGTAYINLPTITF